LRLLFEHTLSLFSETLKYTDMKQIKTIDLFINISLIAGFAIYWIVRQDSSFMLAYFVVGAWQVISMLFHLYNRCFTYKGSSRTIYNWIALISIITMPLGSFWILLFTAPFMAVYYTYMCYYEITVKMQRPIALLK
jgi:hypothetical protein